MTLPLEAPEGRLGAATLGLSAHVAGVELMQRLRAMAAMLAQALTHAKCKHDHAVGCGCAGLLPLLWAAMHAQW